jgi:hypothetical protein
VAITESDRILGAPRRGSAAAADSEREGVPVFINREARSYRPFLYGIPPITLGVVGAPLATGRPCLAQQHAASGAKVMRWLTTWWLGSWIALTPRGITGPSMSRCCWK